MILGSLSAWEQNRQSWPISSVNALTWASSSCERGLDASRYAGMLKQVHLDRLLGKLDC